MRAATQIKQIFFSANNCIKPQLQSTPNHVRTSQREKNALITRRAGWLQPSRSTRCCRRDVNSLLCAFRCCQWRTQKIFMRGFIQLA